MDEIFGRSKAAGCLSHFQISQLALKNAAQADFEQGQTHVHTCERCAGLLKHEMQEMHAAQYERVPQALQGKVQTRRRLFSMAWMGALSAAAAAITLLLAMPKSEGPLTRTKGADGLELSLMRQENLIETLIFDRMPIIKVRSLKAGDRLRLHFNSATPSHVLLQNQEGNAATEVFSGALPADGWLPVGLTVTAGMPVQLQWWLCDGDREYQALRNNKPNHCERNSASLAVQP